MRLPAVAVFAVLLLTYGFFVRTARDENSNSRLGLIFAVAREGLARPCSASSPTPRLITR